ncbi:MAG: hypothetical protein RO469_13165 [Thermincola sp.]|nr:hypothetical protein [Thermincola sp.]MDT3703695.1 hypothetical protein [Thermincola sp.]
MQIGNIHFGKAETAVPPSMSIMEAALLWDLLVGRYKCIRETMSYSSLAHDPDWKAVLEYGLRFLQNQAGILEEQAKIYQLPLPDRPPLDISLVECGTALQDRFMFALIFEGCQIWIDFLARATRSMVTNDPLRHVIGDLLNGDLSMFDKLVKFGRIKGWLEPTPMYKPN